jgi:hypothetical protein
MDKRRGYKIDEIAFYNDTEKDFKDFLKYVIERYGINISKAAAGITKQVISKGLGSLTSNQSVVFQKEILDIYTQKECDSCDTKISWNEMQEIIPKNEEDGKCSYCRHREEKDD